MALSTHDFSHCHFRTGSHENPDVQTLFLFLSNTLQLLHLCHLLHGISHPDGKCLWSLSSGKAQPQDPTDVHAMGEPKEFGNGQVRTVGDQQQGAPSLFCLLWHLEHSHQIQAMLPCITHQDKTLFCAEVQMWTTCPRGSTLGCADQFLLYSWKGCTEAREADGVKSCPNYVNRSIVIVFSGARLSLQGTCQKIPIPICIFLFQDEN